LGKNPKEVGREDGGTECPWGDHNPSEDGTVVDLVGKIVGVQHSDLAQILGAQETFGTMSFQLNPGFICHLGNCTDVILQDGIHFFLTQIAQTGIISWN
jgi:hypothetical protein